MIIAVDTGGTKTLIGQFTEAGQLTSHLSLPTPTNVDDYLEAVTQQVQQLAAGQPVTTLSVALPGIVRDGVAVRCINLGWQDVPMAALLRQRFPAARILIENDANLAGLASMCRLENIPRCGLYVTIGTGVGTALILDGQLHSSLKDCEGGHMMLSFDGQERSWEDIASGRTLQSIYGHLSHDTSPEAWPDIARRICVGLRVLVAFVQPDVIVIGGGVGVYTDQFGDILSGLLAEQLPSLIAVPRIVAAPYPTQTVLYGCYDYAISPTQSPDA